jgi:type I restriction enzyme M protein
VQLIDARTFLKKMRKSLGHKRNEIAADNRKHILDLYGAFRESEFSKIFANTDFAYRQITIERPLRLNFQVSPERMDKVKETGAFQKADPKVREMVLNILENFSDKSLYKNRDKFLKVFYEQFEMKIMTAQLSKAIKDALSERDETADVCMDKNGHPESDSELRDSENVPYHQDVREYFEKEVKPFVSDSWINESVVDVKDGKIGKVGYEIPLTRYFYKYQAPRSLEEIESDIEGVENELLELLKKL